MSGDNPLKIGTLQIASLWIFFMGTETELSLFSNSLNDDGLSL